MKATHYVCSLLALTLTVAGCATKRTLPPAPAGAATDTNNEAGDDGRDPAMAGLQRDLATSAGSDRVFFALEASDLTIDARQTLTRQAEWLRQHPRVNFTIEGHCDERGTRDYNLALGERRAKSAADFLISQGIAAPRIRTISYGKERPERLGSDESDYAQNRRAVSIVVAAN